MGYAFAVRSSIDFIEEADEVESEDVLMSALTDALGRPATDQDYQSAAETWIWTEQEQVAFAMGDAATAMIRDVFEYPSMFAGRYAEYVATGRVRPDVPNFEVGTARGAAELLSHVPQDLLIEALRRQGFVGTVDAVGAEEAGSGSRPIRPGSPGGA